MTGVRNVVVILLGLIAVLSLYANINFLFQTDRFWSNPDCCTTETSAAPTYRDERYHLFSQCMYLSFYHLQDIQVWDNIRQAFDYCNSAIRLNKEHIIAYQNNDEVKYHMDPIDITQVTDCHIITLGIGHDVRVETTLKEKFSNTCKFQGADPIIRINKDIYKPIGEYFPFAIGNDTRVEATSVKEDPSTQEYTYRNFSHIELIEFLSDKAKVPSSQIIDQLLLDIEYAEFAMVDYFFLNGKLDSAGYTICQWNGEFHYPNDNQKAEFGRLMKQIAKDERYLFFNLDNTYHTRLYFVNVADQRCFDRYVSGRI
ncbi:hypothetical protein QR680_010146 [Steinernema hermaphroditum]|uniref:Methyltransferase FkbM domain-containing protein n=1 Tax=Steinernema hermaphroditum TaxID=289476 RepID=A0AA39IPU3_9BILA|nr:hypothetical protein QR680_010146 [Steinernema hermaphroditum]